MDEKAVPSRGTTEPGTELAREASASNTRLPTGCTAFSACATWESRSFGSLSFASTDTHAKAWPLCSAHCDNSVVFPYPAGATTDTMGRESSRASRSISDERRMVPGRTKGRSSFAAARSNASLLAPFDWLARCRTSLTLMPRLVPHEDLCPCSVDGTARSSGHQTRQVNP